MPPSLYDRLGVSRGADSNEIKKAYRKMALVHHPDKGGNPEEFKHIQHAYDILSDDRRKAIYDQTGQEDSSSDAAEGIPFSGGMPFPMGGMGGPFGAGDIPFNIGNLFGMFGPHGPGGIPGHPGGQRPQQRGQKAPPKVHELPISLWDYYHGKQIRIQFERQKFCEACKGSGADTYEPCGGCGGSGVKQQMMMMGPGMNVLMRGPCDACGGEGKRVASACKSCAGKKCKNQEKALDFKIEPGMRPGEVIRFANECSDQAEFVEPGDVHINLQEADEAIRFKRFNGGDDLCATTTISLKDALLGCKETMDTHPGHPQGLVLEIPAGVQHGECILVEGEGMPRRGMPGRGALRVTVSVVPTEAEKRCLVGGAQKIREVFGVTS